MWQFETIVVLIWAQKKLFSTLFLQRSIQASSPSHPSRLPTPPASLCAMDACTLTASSNARVPSTQGDVEILSSAPSSTPKPRSEEIPVSQQSLHPSPHSSRLPMPCPQTWFMKLALPGEKMRQSAWRRPPGCRSFPSQAPVGWWQGGWSSLSQSLLLTLIWR